MLVPVWLANVKWRCRHALRLKRTGHQATQKASPTDTSPTDSTTKASTISNIQLIPLLYTISSGVRLTMSSENPCDASPDLRAAPLTEPTVRTWDHKQVYCWLASLTPPPLSWSTDIILKFKDGVVDGVVFLAASTNWYIERGLPWGVAKRLTMLADEIRKNTLVAKRSAEGSPHQSPKGKKRRLDGDPDIVITQKSEISVEELAAGAYGKIVDALERRSPSGTFLCMC